MKKKVIILANTEKLCAYLLTSYTNAQHAPRIEQIDATLPNSSPAHSEEEELLNRFYKGKNKSDTAKNQSESTENDTGDNTCMLDSMANKICDIIIQKKSDIWDLAAPEDLSGQLFERLPINVLKKITNLKRADYTRLSIGTVERVFAS